MERLGVLIDNDLGWVRAPVAGAVGAHGGERQPARGHHQPVRGDGGSVRAPAPPIHEGCERASLGWEQSTLVRKGCGQELLNQLKPYIDPCWILRTLPALPPAGGQQLQRLHARVVAHRHAASLRACTETGCAREGYIG